MFPNVSTEALVCALVLSEEGNLSRTAERLHTSSSNVSRKLSSLQTSWGVQLFNRNLSGFDLTAEGRVSIHEIRKSVEYTQRGFDLAVNQAIYNRKPFRVGHSLYIHSKILPFLESRSVPNENFSRLVLNSATTTQLKVRVLRGEVQVGFGVMPIVDRDLDVTPILREGFSLCIPTAHRLKDKLRLSIRDIADENLYWMPRFIHPAFYDHVTGYLRGAGYDLCNLHEAQAITEGIDFVQCKSGVALMPQSAARFQCPGVLFKPVTDRPLWIETAVFVRRDQMQGPVREFVNTALAELQPAKLELN